MLAWDPEIGKASDLSKLRFNHYTDTIQAAVNGEGVALGWAELLTGHLKEGRLIRLGLNTLTLEAKYHVLVPLGRTRPAPVLAFLKWISTSFERAGLSGTSPWLSFASNSGMDTALGPVDI